MEKGYAIQGFEGCFHQMAVNGFYGQGSKVIYCRTFRELVRTAEDPDVSLGGLMAIENTIAGSILPNYNLLSNSSLFITGETYLKIEQQLLVNRGVSLDEIEEVQSHPMALQQCSAFLEKHNWRMVESADTGLSAKEIAVSKTRRVAAVASALAAGLFDLHIAAHNIHTLQHNYTRFLSLSINEDYPDDANKASVYFETDHKTGSLANVLNVISETGINLSKLQSIPIPGSNWKYGFYADMDFNSRWQLERAVVLLKNSTNILRMQGIYKKGSYYDNGKATG
jgi:prephenate dehydratase